MSLLLLALGAASFELSNTLGSHMVLQRDAPALIWGLAASGIKVNALFKGANFSGTSDASGVWRISLPATQAGGPFDIAITSTAGSATLTDVLFGDVYLCSGQSNMAFALNTADNATAEKATASTHGHIRIFRVGQHESAGPQRQLPSVAQAWTPSTPANVGTFSAVCWFFGRDLYDDLQGKVPIGLVESNQGGTPIQFWSSSDAIAKCGYKGANASVLYNGMLAPYAVGPMRFIGMTWYQGEQNVNGGATTGPTYYACQEPAMIRDLRTKFKNDKLWFGFVHLAGHRYGAGDAQAGDLRAAQLAALSEPLVGFATAVDIGNASNIHPTHKQPVARRLANAALTQMYGKHIVWKAPVYKHAVAVTSGTKVTVTIEFESDSIGGGLTHEVPELAKAVLADQCQAAGLVPNDCGFPTIVINDKDHTALNATATITTDKKGLIFTATMPSPGGYQAVSTSYGRRGWAVTTFFTTEGLPVLGWFSPVA